MVYFAKFERAPDKARDLLGQVVRQFRVFKRTQCCKLDVEVGSGKLIDRFGPTEVLKAVIAETEQVGAFRQRVARQFCRRG